MGEDFVKIEKKNEHQLFEGMPNDIQALQRESHQVKRREARKRWKRANQEEGSLKRQNSS